MSRFLERNVLLFGKKQTAVGTPVSPAAANALACLELTYERKTSTEDFVYKGDALDRDGESTITDETAEMKAKVFFPVTGTPGADLASEEWFEAAGGAIVTVASTSVEITNSAASDEVLTTQFRRSTVSLATQKSYQTSDCAVQADLEIEIGKRVMLDFSIMGNVGNPTQETAITPDYQGQKTVLGPIIRKDQLSLTELVIGGGAATGTGNICFSKVAAPNWLGFSYTRQQDGCEEQFVKEAETGDLTLTILEDNADASYVPEVQIGKVHSLYIKTGTVAGKKADFSWTKLQLVGVKDTTVQTTAAKDLSFKVQGSTSALLT